MAAWYDRLVGDEGSDYHRHVILPTALRLLDVQPDERVLDLCCGQGVLTRMLAQVSGTPGPQSTADAAAPGIIAGKMPASQQAAGGMAASQRSVHERTTARIIGVDASPRLIAAAKSRGPTDPSVCFLVRDARRLGDLADTSFDAAACIMAVQDVDDTAALFDQLSLALRPGGRAVMVLMHPCFRVPRQSEWGWDETKKTQYRRIDRYLTPMQVPIATQPGSDPGQQTFFHHRPLSAYINALGAAGLAVVAADEPVTHRAPPPGTRHRGQKRSFEEIPVFLALKAIKVGSASLKVRG